MMRKSTIRASRGTAPAFLGLALVLVLPGLGGGCKRPGNDGGPPGPDSSSTDAGGPCIPPAVTWGTAVNVDVTGSGFENVLRFAPNGDPWITSMRAATCDAANPCTGMGTCMGMPVPDVCNPSSGICQGCCNFGGEVAQYQILFFMPDGAGGFTSEIVAAEEYVSLTGVGMEIDPLSGDPCMAYTGSAGGAAPILACGAHDLLFSCRTGGTWSAPATVIALSATGDVCTAGQDACNVGDVTGLWPSLAFSMTGEAGIAYRDQHNGWNKIDQTVADLEVALRPPGGGAWVASAPYNSEGGGLYPTITFDLTGEPVVAHDSLGEGVILTRRTAGTWGSTVVTPVEGGQRINVAVAADGTIYVAYYTSLAGEGRLSLATSTDDGMTFVASTIDTSGVTGQNPSFVISPDGVPSVAYYKCSDSGACTITEDDLKYAYLSCGAWQRMSVTGVADTTTFAGRYPSLDYDADGNPGIAYQESWSDPGSGTLYRVTKLIRGTITP